MDIAVIGISGKFPEADSIYEFYENLKGRRDSVRKVPKSRLELNGQSLEKEYCILGYLDEIAEFDYNFFKLSHREAMQMDPHQRLALQEACRTILDSGYSLKEFRGTKTAVILGCGDSGYQKLLNERDGVSIIGNLKSVTAGRIAYNLDLNGPVCVVDTSCSSSLLAVHQACNHLSMMEADYALAGGVSVNSLIPEMDELKDDTLGIASPSGKVKAFDEDADGSGGGEGCAFILLKRLEEAIRDNDNIYAVIKGSSINHDAARSNSLAAPSPVAQTDVIIDAWEKSQVDPLTITYIEAHGTGTKIGDPIEVKALTDAFKKYTQMLGFCEISAVKSNIGHTGYNAGISSMIKCILAIYYKVKFPLINFKSPNKMIDFAQSAIYPCTELTEWNDDIRRAGVSSFGLSGTNVHMIIEQAPNRDESKVNNNKYYPVLISAMNKSVLKNYCENMYSWLGKHNESLSDIAFTQCVGRDVYDYKKIFIVKSNQELRQLLLQGYDYKKSSNNRQCLFFCSNDINVTDDDLKKLKFVIDEMNEVIGAYLNSSKNQGKIREVITQIALYKLWRSMGINPTTVIGCGYGNITVSYVLGKITLEDAINKAKNYSDNDYEFNRIAFVEAIKKFTVNDNMYIELGDRGILSDVLIDNFNNIKENIFYSLGTHENHHNVFINLVEQGIEVDWKMFFNDGNGRRISLPTYPFEKNICWVKDIVTNNLDSKIIVENKTETFDLNSEDTKAFIKKLWQEVLEVDEIGDNDDFYDIGGNSLMAMQIINRVKEFKNIKLEFDDLYDYCTINLLAEYIDSLDDDKDNIKEDKSVDNKNVLSFLQESMLFIYKQNVKSTAYNMPAIIKVTGELNALALYEAMNYILFRHEVLRTIYIDEDGVYKPVVLENVKIPYHFDDISDDINVSDKVKFITKNFNTNSFDLTKEIPLKIKIIKTSQKEYLLFIQMHHIAADGWSIGILLSELSYYYKEILLHGKAEPKKLLMSFSDYAAKNRNLILSDIGQRKIDFWKRHLEGLPAHLNFPIDKKRSDIFKNNGSCYRFEFSDKQTKRIMEFCKNNGITVYVFLFTVYSILLYRYSNQSNFCIGTPVANRSGINEEKIIGFFANTLPIHVKIDNSLSFNDYLFSTKDLLGQALNNQEIPFDIIVKNLKIKRNTSYTPIFQHSFVFQNMSTKLKLNGLNAEFLDTTTYHSKFEIMMVVTQSKDHFKGAIEYSTDLFYEESMISLAEHYKTLIDNIISNPKANIDEISILTNEEKIDIITNVSDYKQEDYDF